jgi:diaminopimelate epimerase
MKFHKLSGAGNDFIVLNNLDGHISPSDYGSLAARLCQRRLSIGADGLMVVEPSATADFAMAFYNADGSTGEMCGNGARCICRYGYEMGLAGERQTVQTPSGLVTGVRLDKRRYRVQLTPPTCIDLSRPVEALGSVYDCAYIELGTPGLPHAVVVMPGLAQREETGLRELGRTLRHHPAFPKGANVNFYDPQSPRDAVLKTFERGVEDFTYACGTGSGATALTMLLRAGEKTGSVTLHNTGGDLVVDVEEDGAGYTLRLTGPTTLVAAGEILDEELENRNKERE